MKECQLRLIFSRISNLSVISFFLSHYNYHLNNNLSLFRPLITFFKFQMKLHEAIKLYSFEDLSVL